MYTLNSKILKKISNYILSIFEFIKIFLNSILEPESILSELESIVKSTEESDSILNLTDEKELKLENDPYNIETINILKDDYTKIHLFYDKLSNGEKKTNSDTIITACFNYICTTLKYGDHGWFIEFCNMSNIIKYCNIGIILRCLDETYYLNNISLYKYLISVCLKYEYNMLLNDHLIKFYTHKKITNINKFKEIYKMLLLNHLEIILNQAVLRDVGNIIYFMLHNCKKEIKTFNIKQISIEKYINVYNNILKLNLNIPNDINNTILKHLFG